MHLLTVWAQEPDLVSGKGVDAVENAFDNMFFIQFGAANATQ